MNSQARYWTNELALQTVRELLISALISKSHERSFVRLVNTRQRGNAKKHSGIHSRINSIDRDEF